MAPHRAGGAAVALEGGFEVAVETEGRHAVHEELVVFEELEQVARADAAGPAGVEGRRVVEQVANGNGRDGPGAVGDAAAPHQHLAVAGKEEGVGAHQLVALALEEGGDLGLVLIAVGTAPNGRVEVEDPDVVVVEVEVAEPALAGVEGEEGIMVRSGESFVHRVAVVA